ncbi:MAG: hypothetical protein ACRCVE_10190 [Plesiomonas sp.]
MRYALSTSLSRKGRQQPTKLITQLLTLRNHQAKRLHRQLNKLNSQLIEHTQNTQIHLQQWKNMTIKRSQHTLAAQPTNNIKIQLFKTECDLYFARERQSYQQYLDIIDICKECQLAISEQQNMINSNCRSQEKLRSVLERL